MLSFYETMLNIKQMDTKQILQILNKIITDDVETLYKNLISLDLNVNKININELYKEMPSYKFLILRYQDLKNNCNYILIDPNYGKLLKNNNEKSPLYFEAWPSEILQNINPMLLKDLLKNKYSYIDDKTIRDYLKSLVNKEVNINLETIILEKYKERNRRI